MVATPVLADDGRAAARPAPHVAPYPVTTIGVGADRSATERQQDRSESEGHILSFHGLG